MNMSLAARALILSALAGALVLAGITPATAAPVKPIGSLITVALEREYSGSDLNVGKAFSSSAKYTKLRVSYESGGLTISGIMIKPRGKGPLPVVVLAHGYINPATYWSSTRVPARTRLAGQ